MYVKEATDNEIVIEKSRFICYMMHIEDEPSYKEYLASIRKKHHDASHVCSALICGNIRRSSDDGEPAGTAGAPILNVLEKKGLDQTCAIVVRYFGGIKLGAGGLIRAYGNAVSSCLDKAILCEDISYPKYRISLPYDIANRLERYLRSSTFLLNSEYGTEISYTFAIDNPEKLDKISEICKGLKPQCIGEETIQKVIQ